MTYEPLNLLGQQDFTTTAPIFVGDLAGQTGTLLFTLKDVSDQEASILLDNITSSAVPEPATLSLLVLAALCLAGYLRRRKRVA